MEQKAVFKSAANHKNTSGKISSEFAAWKQEFSLISNTDNMIIEINANHCNNKNIINATHLPNSPFAFNHPINQ